MSRYIMKRLLMLIPVILGVTILIFTLMALLQNPGNTKPFGKRWA